MTESVQFIGGSAADRKAVIDQHRAYLEANAVFDFDRLEGKIWSPAPEASFFNLNGHTYTGRDHWVRLWKYYKQHMQTGTWIPYDIHCAISGDLAVVWCHRKTKLAWTGTDPRPDNNRHKDKEFTSRSTMTFHRENGEWRVVHTHFSEGSDDPRPGGI
jgi:ketosteroid isomerase-like protein